MVSWPRTMQKQEQGGYVALLSVLIIGAVATAIAVAVLSLGASEQQAALVEVQGKLARSAAIACVEQNLKQIHDSTTSVATASLNYGTSSCYTTVSSPTQTTRLITSYGSSGSANREIQVNMTIGSTNLSVTSWQEVSM